MSQIAPIIDPLAGGSIAHIEPSVCPVFADPSAPVVEVLRMFFPGNIDGAAKADVVARWNRFADKVLREPGASGPIAANWTLETNVEVPGQPDKQAVAFVALVAWASIERHMQCRDTQVFTDNIGILRELPGLIKLDMFHVKCQTLHSKDVARGALAESS
jgi:hypothetical protein